MCPLYKINNCIDCEGLFSNWMIFKHNFKTHLSKIKLRWNFPNFWPKSWFIPLKKIQYGDHVKFIFYSLEGLVFLNSWSVYFVTCWLHDILIYLLNYCSSGKSTYWLNNLVIYWLTWFTNWMNDLLWLYRSWWIAWLC